MAIWMCWALGERCAGRRPRTVPRRWPQFHPGLGPFCIDTRGGEFIGMHRRSWTIRERDAAGLTRSLLLSIASVDTLHFRSVPINASKDGTDWSVSWVQMHT
jgi:hypothetical protein